MHFNPPHREVLFAKCITFSFLQTLWVISPLLKSLQCDIGKFHNNKASSNTTLLYIICLPQDSTAHTIILDP